MNLKDLSKEFPRSEVHWLPKALTKAKDKALALAYIDARNVMDRLDEVCGPENWQDEYTETAKGRIICRIGIKIGDEWVWKSDGAGETAVEGDKGGISDAMKRAGVKWGIGRYLYDMPPRLYVQCSTFNDKFSDWKEDPWVYVDRARKRGNDHQEKPTTKAPTERNPRELADALISAIGKCKTLEQWSAAVDGKKFSEAWDWLGLEAPAMAGDVKKAVDEKQSELGRAETYQGAG